MKKYTLAVLLLCFYGVSLSFAQIVNGDFESWSNTTLNSWTTIDNGIIVTKELTNIHTNTSASVKVTTKTQDKTDIRQTISIVSGHEYTISVWIKHTEGNIKARLFRDGFAGYSDKNNTSWQQITSVFTATKTEIEIGLRFYDQTGFDGSEIVYIDDFRIIDNTTTVILNWDSNIFSESKKNDGSIQNTIGALLLGDTFKNGTLELNTDFITTNIPSGLTVSITTVSSTQVSVTLTGFATNHTSSNNITDMGIEFTDNAFENSNAKSVINSSKQDININFYDNYTNKLLITEIYYNPPESGSDSLEFIEIYNNDTVTINLKDYMISSAIDYTFGNISIKEGDYIVIAKDSVSILNTFGVNVNEWTSGVLNNTSEIIKLMTPDNELIDSVKYSNKKSWADANGTGYSLVLCNYNLDNSLPKNWVLSTNYVDTNSNGVKIYASPLHTDTIYNINPILNWDKNIFKESLNNKGSFDDTITIQLSDEIFIKSEINLTENTHFTTSNIPNGLCVNIYTLNDTTAYITLQGKTTTNNDIDDLTITFLDTAFSRGTAHIVSGYSKDNLIIDYRNITYCKSDVYNSVLIYPNPATNVLYVNNSIIKTEILDINGRKILTTTNNIININSLKKGIYLVKLSSNSILKVEKLIIK